MFAFRALERELRQKNTKISEGFTKTFLNGCALKWKGMERVFDVIIGVYEDDRSSIPQTAPTATSTTTSSRKWIYILLENLATFRMYSAYLLLQELAPIEYSKIAFNPK